MKGNDADLLAQWIERGPGYMGVVSYDRVAVRATERHYGVLTEALNRKGRFVVYGDSFEFHQAVVRGVVQRYERLISSIEDRAIVWEELPQGGATMSGAPVVLEFQREVPDMDLFLDGLLSSRAPFRLWGIPEQVGADLFEVEAVDLHVGQILRMEIMPKGIRVFLSADGCGNTVARLISNLQHYFDGALRILDPEIQGGLVVGASASVG
jgi:hypothetical protein